MHHPASSHASHFPIFIFWSRELSIFDTGHTQEKMENVSSPFSRPKGIAANVDPEMELSWKLNEAFYSAHFFLFIDLYFWSS